MMLAGRRTPSSSPRNRWFSSSSERLCASARRRACTSLAIRLATALMKRRQASSRSGPLSGMSAASVPTTSSPISTGTQMKLLSSWLRSRRRWMRSWKAGSALMRSTTAGRPLSSTRPVMPSPGA